MATSSDESEEDELGVSSDDTLYDPTSRVRKTLGCLLERGCAVLLVIGTILGGALVLKLAENWSFTTSMYVIVQIITTIGYGDVTVTSDGMRLFMAAYVLWNLIMVAYFLNAFLQAMLEMQADKLRQHMRRVERTRGESDRQVRTVWSAWNQVMAAGAHFLGFLLLGTLFYGWIYRGCAVDSSGHATENCVEDKEGMPTNIIQSFYMSVITMTTVGFGDYRPRTTIGRIFAIFWMVGGVATTGFFVSAVQNFFFSVDEDRRIQNVTVHEELDRQTFEEMDTDNNGYLSRSEFRSYVLMKHGVITQKDLDLIDEKFQLLSTFSAAKDYSGIARVTYTDVLKFHKSRSARRVHG